MRAEFNRLVKFAPGGIRDDEATKMQKFRDGLNLDCSWMFKVWRLLLLGT